MAQWSDENFTNKYNVESVGLLKWVLPPDKQTNKQNMIYDINVLQFGFHPVAVVGKLVQTGKRQLYTKEETILKTIHKHRIHKIENKHTKQGNRHKKNIKTIGREIRK